MISEVVAMEMTTVEAERSTPATEVTEEEQPPSWELQ
jgi:hypothetical protein